MKIDNKILNDSWRCEKNFACQNNDTHLYCNVEFSVYNGAIFVNCKDNPPCVYKSSFGTSFMCKCPARNEIFVKYKR